MGHDPAARCHRRLLDAARWAPRLRGRAGWRDKITVFSDSVLISRLLFERPLRHWLALVGALTFWAAEIFAVWAGLAVFGFGMDGAALVVGFCTGMAFTRRIAPLAGAGMLTLVLPLAIWYSGAPPHTHPNLQQATFALCKNPLRLLSAACTGRSRRPRKPALAAGFA